MTEKLETVANLADVQAQMRSFADADNPANPNTLRVWADRIERALSAQQPEPATTCWQHRPGSPCPTPDSCRSNGCSAVEREIFPDEPAKAGGSAPDDIDTEEYPCPILQWCLDRGLFGDEPGAGEPYYTDDIVAVLTEYEAALVAAAEIEHREGVRLYSARDVQAEVNREKALSYEAGRQAAEARIRGEASAPEVTEANKKLIEAAKLLNRSFERKLSRDERRELWMALGLPFGFSPNIAVIRAEAKEQFRAALTAALQQEGKSHG